MNYKKITIYGNILVLLIILMLLVLTLTNQVFLAVVEGRSMEPLLQTGDIVIVHRVGVRDLDLNDIIVYEKYDGSLVIHRIVSIYNKSKHIIIVTKGDNNVFPDPPISPDQVIGRVLEVDGLVIKVPVAGYLSLIIKYVFSRVPHITAPQHASVNPQISYSRDAYEARNN